MSGRRPTLTEHLRTQTADAHARLEARLNLLRPQPSRDRFVALLSGFLGFHLAWEPAVRRRPAGDLIGFSRVELLRADLAGLGVSPAALDAIRPWDAAAALASTPAAALGSAYVMEGSTLGGQVIDRALAAAPWRPPAGLRYFTPYGAGTGVRWRAFKQALDDTPPSVWPEATAGACATFALLAERLPLSEGDTA